LFGNCDANKNSGFYIIWNLGKFIRQLFGGGEILVGKYAGQGCKMQK